MNLFCFDNLSIGRPGVIEHHHDSVTSDLQYIDGRVKSSSRTSSFEIENLLKTAEQVTTYCRSPQETRKSSPTGSVTSSASNAVLTPSRQLTDAEKLRKVILELVDTERAYVKVRIERERKHSILLKYIENWKNVGGKGLSLKALEKI